MKLFKIFIFISAILIFGTSSFAGFSKFAYDVNVFSSTSSDSSDQEAFLKSLGLTKVK